MALIEKKVIQEVLVCDSCENVIEGDTATKLSATATGYMKRDHFELDLCEGCATNIGLRRRGRRPGSVNADGDVEVIVDGEAQVPLKRGPGRPRKNPVMATDPNAPPKRRGRPPKSSYMTVGAPNPATPPEPAVVETSDEEWES